MAGTRKSSTIKYSDKSEAQPELAAFFQQLKSILGEYVKGNYVVKDDLPGNFSVYYQRPVQLAGRTYPTLPFAALLVQKGYVGFYFFCVYTHPHLRNSIPANLLKKLKGKSCFHLKPSDNIGEVREVLDAGYKLYSSLGWN